ncbi:hypothetical protein D9M68_118570 [compost metagenome]
MGLCPFPEKGLINSINKRINPKSGAKQLSKLPDGASAPLPTGEAIILVIHSSKLCYF